MKVIFAILLISFGSISFAGSSKGEIVDGKFGFYYQRINSMEYRVDTITEICTVHYYHKSRFYGMAVIPCEKLKKRPEWKQYITWVK